MSIAEKFPVLRKLSGNIHQDMAWGILQRVVFFRTVHPNLRRTSGSCDTGENLCFFTPDTQGRKKFFFTCPAPLRNSKGVICLYGTWTKRLCAAFLSLLVCAVSAFAVDGKDLRLIPVGHTVGIKLFSQGVMVVKLTDGDTPARESGLQTGDVIIRCGGAAVTSAEQFQSLLQQGDNGAELEVQRDGGEITLLVEPERNEEGVCQIGAWIRDSMAGIGTMTWYNPESHVFGALGHGVTDVDTALLMPFHDGAVLFSSVKAVKKGESGSAGELRGDFDLTADLGTLYANTEQGVFGNLADTSGFSGETENVDEWFSREALPVGEPVRGTAEILANVRGDEVGTYEIEILKVLPDSEDGRDMILSITDPALLDITGGIVQGMSGSPVIQDGKLVGAVTQVFLQDPSKGYGISIATMLDAV